MGTRLRARGVAVALLVAATSCAVNAHHVGEASGPRSGPPFVRSLPARTTLVWAVGDGADGGAAARALARYIASTRPARFLYLGDVYDSGTAGEFAHNYAPVYGRLAAVTAPTPGNHDWPNHDVGYDPYWRRVHGVSPPAYYSFRAGGWQIVSLDSEAPHGRETPQLRWLRSAVRGPGTCRIAFWHRPRWSAGEEHGDQPDVAAFWDALRGHAAIVLNGHEHDMQRFAPRDGITEFVAGAGGASRYPIDRSHPGLAFADDTHWGALRLTLRPGEARFAFVATGGRVLDAGTIPCRTR